MKRLVITKYYVVALVSLLFGPLLTLTSQAEGSNASPTCPLAINESDYDPAELDDLKAKGYLTRNIGPVDPLQSTHQKLNLAASNGFFMQRFDGRQFLDKLMFWRDSSNKIYLRVFLPYFESSDPAQPIFFAYNDVSSLMNCEQMNRQLLLLIHDRAGSIEVLRSLNGEGSGRFGRLLLGLERKHLARNGQFFDLDKAALDYDQLLLKLQKKLDEKKDLEVKDPKSLEPVRDLVVRTLQTYGLGSDCQGKSQISSYFIRRCGDCNSNTMLLLSVWRDLNLPIPEGYVLGSEQYIDHIAPVLYNKSSADVIDLYTWNRRKAGSNSIVSPEYLVANAVKFVGIRLLEDEVMPEVDSGLVLFEAQMPEKWPENFPQKYIDYFEQHKAPMRTRARADLILDGSQIPGSYSCFIAGCKSPPGSNQHDIFGKLEEVKPYEGEVPKETIIREMPFCPFVIALPRSPRVLEDAREYPAPSKGGFRVAQLPPGYFWKVKTTELEYTTIRCSDIDSARIVLEAKSEEELAKERGESTEKDDGSDSTIKVDFKPIRNNRFSFGRSVSEQLQNMDKEWGRHYNAVLEIPKHQCKSEEKISNAFQLCHMAQGFQEETAEDWKRRVYPFIRNIAQQRNPVHHFQDFKHEWKNLKTVLQDSHRTLFNRARPDQEVVALLIKAYVEFPALVSELQQFRKSLGQQAAHFLVSFSELDESDQVLFFEVLSEISYHISYMTRILREQGLDLAQLNERLGGLEFTDQQLQFAGGLTENILRAYVQTSKTSAEEMDQDKLEQTGAELVKNVLHGQESATLPKVNLPKAKWDGSADCETSDSTFVSGGAGHYYECPRAKALSLSTLKPSPLALPLMMAESERETLRPQNLLMIMDLWAPENEKALEKFMKVPFIESFFESGVNFLNRNIQQISTQYRDDSKFDWTQLAFLRLFLDWKGRNWSENQIEAKLDDNSKYLSIRNLKSLPTDEQSSDKFDADAKTKMDWEFNWKMSGPPQWVLKNTKWRAAYERVKKGSLMSAYFELFDIGQGLDTQAFPPFESYYSSVPKNLRRLSHQLFFLAQMKDTVVKDEELVFKGIQNKFEEFKSLLMSADLPDGFKEALLRNPSLLNEDREILEKLKSEINRRDLRVGLRRAREVWDKSDAYHKIADSQALQISAYWSDSDSGGLWADTSVSGFGLEQPFNRPTIHYGRHLVIEKFDEIEIYPWGALKVIQYGSGSTAIVTQAYHLLLVNWQNVIDNSKNYIE